MLSKNLLSSLLTQIPVFILGVVSGIFSTRILGEDAKGVFSLFQANSQLFVLLFSVGIQTGIVYFISSGKMPKQLVIKMAFMIFSFNSILLAIFLFVSNAFGFSSIFLPEKYTSLVYLFSLFLMYFFALFNSLIAAVFQAHSDFKTINFIALANSLLNAGLFVALFYFSKNKNLIPINSVITATLAVLCLNSILWIFFLIKKHGFSAGFSFHFDGGIKTFLLYNSSIYLGMLINFFNYRLDLWIVNHYLNEKELSYYSLAANINQIILYVAVTIGSVLLPNLSSKSDDERNKTFILIVRFCFIAFFVGVTFAYYIAPFIIPFMYGTDFSSTVLPFQILLPGILFSCITQLFSIYIVSINRNKYNIIACAAGLIVTLILDLWLIPMYGITGAAIATSVSYFIIFLITYIFVVMQLKTFTLNTFVPKSGDYSYLLQLLKKN